MRSKLGYRLSIVVVLSFLSGGFLGMLVAFRYALRFSPAMISLVESAMRVFL